MKELLILSGKGGTGKTTVASAFIKLSNARRYGDCDVDAPNLHLTSKWDSEPNVENYYGLPKAYIDKDICSECDLCRKNCRFDAISVKDGYNVNPFSCEGCGVCHYLCPEHAISLLSKVDGEMMLYSDQDHAFSTAQLKMGSGNSGMLVSQVKKRLRSVSEDEDFAIIDGSPGIGCPVIASLSGVDMVLIVAEPSITGIFDMKRIINTASKFAVKIAVSINKFDVNIDNTEKIEEFCKKEGLPFMGKIPYDPQAAKAINSGLTIVDIDCRSGSAVMDLYEKTMDLFFQDKNLNVRS